MEQVLYSPREIAEKLGYTHQNILYWIKTGKLDSIQVGSGEKKQRYMVTKRQLAEFAVKNLLKKWKVEA